MIQCFSNARVSARVASPFAAASTSNLELSSTMANITLRLIFHATRNASTSTAPLNPRHRGTRATRTDFGLCRLRHVSH
eukprot:493672-Pyramimonas_sp.AAC.1